jgi:hypothetical protein
MITQDILDSFVYETLDGEFHVTDPTEFDQVVPGGPFKTKEEAEKAFTDYVKLQGVNFE